MRSQCFHIPLDFETVLLISPSLVREVGDVVTEQEVRDIYVGVS